MDIILDGEQIFEYRLKFAFPPSEQDVAKVERYLQKFDLIESTAVRHTIFQTNPVDFPQLDAGEIYLLDVTTARAMQIQDTIQELAEHISQHQDLIRIRNMAEPLQSYVTEAEDDLEFDEVYTPKLLDTEYSDAEKIDADEYMGDKLSDKVADEASQHAKNKGLYSEYMVAGYEKMYPKASPDSPAPTGPVKE